MLEDEIGRLRRIRDELEKAKNAGEKEIPAWLNEDTQFQTLLQSVGCPEGYTQGFHQSNYLG